MSYTRDDLCRIIRNYFQSFGKGCQIIRRADFLEEVRYYYETLLYFDSVAVNLRCIHLFYLAWIKCREENLLVRRCVSLSLSTILVLSSQLVSVILYSSLSYRLLNNTFQTSELILTKTKTVLPLFSKKLVQNFSIPHITAKFDEH